MHLGNGIRPSRNASKFWRKSYGSAATSVISRSFLAVASFAAPTLDARLAYGTHSLTGLRSLTAMRRDGQGIRQYWWPTREKPVVLGWTPQHSDLATIKTLCEMVAIFSLMR